MIKIACNYTSELLQLLDEENCDVDYIKYPSLANDDGFKDYGVYRKNINDIMQYKPVLYHGTFPSNIFIGNKDFIKEFDLEAFRHICELTETHGISLHLSGGSSDYSRKETISTVVRNIDYIKSHFPNMAFIAVENLCKTKNPYEVDAEVISEIVEQADINFLYDISHAYKHAYFNGVDFNEYVSKLPLHRVHEIHINGWKIKGDDMQAHMCIHEELYGHIEWLAKNTPVKIMTLEYGRHSDRIDCGCPIVKIGSTNDAAKEEIRLQLGRLHDIVRRVD